MIQYAYATLQDLADYLAVDVSTLTAADQRLLYRASETVYTATSGRYSYENAYSQSEPYPSLARAVCAQVEYWKTNGEYSDTEVPRKQQAFGSVQITFSGGGPQRLAPRAIDALQAVGALYTGVSAS
jgi:hypothetical protein